MPEIMPLTAIMLDKERRLKLTLNAMIHFQQITGKDLLKGINIENFELADIRALIFACLLHEDKALTLEAVGDMITPANMRAVMDSVVTAIKNSFPESKGSDNPK